MADTEALLNELNERTTVLESAGPGVGTALVRIFTQSRDTIIQLQSDVQESERAKAAVVQELAETKAALEEANAKLKNAKNEIEGLKWHVAVLEGAGSSCGFTGDIDTSC